MDQAVTLDTTLDVIGDTSVSTFDSSGATSLATGGGIVNISKSGVMTNVKGTLNVDQAVTLDTTLDVTGATTLSNTLDVTGDTSVSTFDSSGATSLATGGGIVNISKSGVMTTVKGTLNVDQAVTLDTTLDVTGETTLSDTLGVTGATTLGGELTVGNPVHEKLKIHIDNINKYAILEYTPKNAQGTLLGKGELSFGGSQTNVGHSTGDIQFNTAFANRMIIKNDGDVGIGINDPSVKLVVANPSSDVITGDTALSTGVATFIGSNTDTDSILNIVAANHTQRISIGYSGINKHMSGGNWGGDFSIKNSSPGRSLILSTTPTGNVNPEDRLTIKGNGYVGIGINNPSVKLVVANPGSHGITGDTALSTGVATFIGSNTDTDSILNIVAANHTQRISIGYSGINKHMSSGAADNFSIKNSSPGRSLILSTTPTGNVNPEDRLTIDKDGKVGIGTEDPDAKLDVRGQIFCESGINIDPDNNTILINTARHIGHQDNWTPVQITYSHQGQYGGNLFFNTHGNNGSNDNNVSTKMSILHNGKVGIGTNSPNARLHVYDNSTHTELFLGESAANNRCGIIKYIQGSNGVQGRMEFSNYGNNPVPLTILNSGDVGIGTTAPSKKLHVEGSQFIKDSLGFTHGDGDKILLVNNADKSKISHSGQWSVDYHAGEKSTQTGIHRFMTGNGGDWAERMRITNTGSLGIGTIAPAHKLHVAGGTTDLPCSICIENESEFGKAILYLGTSYATNQTGFAKAAIIAEGRNSWSRSNMHFCLNNTSGDDPTNSNDNNVTQADSKMTILSDNGYVGIGTTLPIQNLDFGNTGGNIRMGGVANQDSAATNSIGHMWSNDGLLYSGIKFISNGIDNELGFYAHKNGQSAAEKMRITGIGNVGIGTNDPDTNRLRITSSGITDLSGQMHDTQLALHSLNDKSMGLGVSDTGIGFIQVKEKGTGYSHLILQYDHLGTDLTTSCVGIGKNTNPTHKLDVTGTFRATGATTLSSTLGVTGATTLNSGLTVNGGYVTGNLIQKGALNNNYIDYFQSTTRQAWVGFNGGDNFYIKNLQGGNVEISNNLQVTETLNVTQAATIGGNLTVNGAELRINGNLVVEGTTTTLNTTSLDIKDKDIRLATNSTNNATANGAGFIIEAGSDTDKEFKYNSTGDKFTTNISLDVNGAFNVTGATTIHGGLDMNNNHITNVSGLTVTGGTTTLSSTLSVSGLTTMSGGLKVKRNSYTSTSSGSVGGIINLGNSTFNEAQIHSITKSNYNNMFQGALSLSTCKHAFMVEAIYISEPYWNTNDLSVASFSAGNVGIGTSNPGKQLDVNGTFRAIGHATLKGGLDMETNRITNVLNPVSTQDAATKNYVDVWGQVVTVNVNAAQTKADSAYNLAAAVGTSNLNMNNNKITNVADPTSNQDAATKKYVDDNAGGGFNNITESGSITTITGETAFIPTGGGNASHFNYSSTGNTHIRSKSNSGYVYIQDAGGNTQIGANGSGNLGIGRNPSYNLDVNGSARFSGSIIGSTRFECNGPTLQLVGSNHNYIEFYPQGTSNGRKAYIGTAESTDPNRLVLQAEGQIGIHAGGNNSIELHASGRGVHSHQLRWTSNGSASFAEYGSTPNFTCIVHGKIYANWIYYSGSSSESDRRIKKDIKPVSPRETLDIIHKLNLRKFGYIYRPNIHGEFHKGERQYGFIAQEVMEHYPSAVNMSVNFIPNVHKFYSNNEEFIKECQSNEYNRPFDTCEYIYDNDEIYLKIPIIKDSEADTVNNIYSKIKMDICESLLIEPKEMKVYIHHNDETHTYIKVEKEYYYVYIYGMEINDFHNINPDSISYLYHQAIQDIDTVQQAELTKVENLETQNTELLSKVNNLETENTQLKDKVTDLENQIKAIKEHLGM